MSFFSKLLEDQELLLRATLFSVLIPIFMALFSRFVAPLFVGLILSIICLQYRNMFRLWHAVVTADPFMKLTYGFIAVGSGTTLWIIWVGFDLTLNPLIIGIVAIIAYLGWFNYINTELEEFEYEPIFRGNVDQFDIPRSFDGLISPVAIAGFGTIVMILGESFIRSSASKIVIRESYRWVIVLVVVIYHGLIHQFVRQEYIWYPTHGKTSYIPTDPPTPPSTITPQSLYQYFKQVEKAPRHEEFFQFLDTNLPFLVKRFRELSYTRPLHRLVRIYSYWGNDSRSQLHYLHLCVLASFSRYKVLAIVPRYNRFMFYSYLELLYKLNAIPVDWLSILEFEIGEGKDEFHRLDWIVSRQFDSQIHHYWVSLWDRKIFKGKEGYNKVADEINVDPYNVQADDTWVRDTWELVFTYLTQFIGPEGRKAFDGAFSLDDALDFLARKESLETFQIAMDQRKQDLRNPKNRMVDASIEQTSKAENARKMLRYFERDDEDKQSATQDLARTWTGFWDGLSFRTIVKGLGLVAMVAVNIGILYLLKPLLFGAVLEVIIVTELIAIQLLLIPGDGSGIMDEGRIKDEAKVSSSDQFEEKSGRTKPGQLEFGIFSLLLLLGYAIFLR